MVERLVISREAFKDIDRIIDFNNFRNQSTAYSSKTVKKLYLRFQKIIETPTIGLKTSTPNLYVLIWDNFYIYYKYLGSKKPISIINIFHQKENVTT
jgi:plasmid stabilization system protein ParE